MREVSLRKESGQCERDSGESNRVIVGNADNGGAANANWNHPDNSNDNLGFRVAVVLFLKLREKYGLLLYYWSGPYF